MIKFIKRIIKQYFVCKHIESKVLKKMMCTDPEHIKPKYIEKLKCNECKRTFYGRYFYEYGDERHYVDNYL